MKRFLSVVLFILLSFPLLAQEDKIHLSDASKFVKNAELTKFVYDYTAVASFRTGTGYIEFYPVYVTDLKSGEKITAVKFETVYPDFGVPGYREGIHEIGYIDISEVKELIVFLENYVLPNDVKPVDFGSGVEYTFYSKEIEIEFIREKRRSEGINDVISMSQELNFKINNRPYQNLYYSFSRRLRKLPDFINMLKSTVKYIEENQQ